MHPKNLRLELAQIERMMLTALTKKLGLKPRPYRTALIIKSVETC